MRPPLPYAALNPNPNPTPTVTLRPSPHDTMAADHTLPFGALPSGAALEITRHEFDDCVSRGVGGLLAKYFANSLGSWTPVVAAASADLSANIEPGFPDLDALLQWLSMVRSLPLRDNHPNITRPNFGSHLLSKPGAPLSVAIHLATKHTNHVAGSIRAFGEFHHADTSDETDDDTHMVRFFHRALLVFKAQPTRYFLHGFVVRANTVDLWVFDRSGAYSSEKFHLGQTPELLV